jgi:hypothetical protein
MARLLLVQPLHIRLRFHESIAHMSSVPPLFAVATIIAFRMRFFISALCLIRGLVKVIIAPTTAKAGPPPAAKDDKGFGV